MLTALLLWLTVEVAIAQVNPSRQFFTGPLAPAPLTPPGQVPPDGVAQYQFGYQTEDPVEATYSQQNEQRNGNSVTGFYSLLLPDGRVQVVNYVADEAGYRASIAYQTPDGRPLPSPQQAPGAAPPTPGPQVPTFQFSGPLPALTADLGGFGGGGGLVKRQIVDDGILSNEVELRGEVGDGFGRLDVDDDVNREDERSGGTDDRTALLLQDIGALPLSSQVDPHLSGPRSLPSTSSSLSQTSSSQLHAPHEPVTTSDERPWSTGQPEDQGTDLLLPLTAQPGSADGWTPLQQNPVSPVKWRLTESSPPETVPWNLSDNSSPELRSWVVADASLPVSSAQVNEDATALPSVEEGWKIAKDGDFKSVAVEDREGSWTVLAPADNQWQLRIQRVKPERKYNTALNKVGVGAQRRLLGKRRVLRPLETLLTPPAQS